jgi:hypothetical protein
METLRTSSKDLHRSLMFELVLTVVFLGAIVLLEECFGLGTPIGLRGNGDRDL